MLTQTAKNQQVIHVLWFHRTWEPRILTNETSGGLRSMPEARIGVVNGRRKPRVMLRSRLFGRPADRVDRCARGRAHSVLAPRFRRRHQRFVRNEIRDRFEVSRNSRRAFPTVFVYSRVPWFTKALSL